MHPSVGFGDGQFGTEHGGQAVGPSRLREPDDAVEAIAVGHRKSGQTEPYGFLHQLFGVGGTVGETEIRMAVQLGIGHRRRLGSSELGSLIGLAFAGPGRRVAAVAGGPGVGFSRRGAPGEAAFEFVPRHRRIAPTHRTNIRSFSPTLQPPSRQSATDSTSGSR